MRNYMPGPHRRFLEHVAKTANIRSYAMSLPAASDVRKAYNSAVMMLGSFRDKHIRIVSRYIIAQARQQQYQPRSNEESTSLHTSTSGLSVLKRLNLATATLLSQSSLSSSSSSSSSPPSDSPSSSFSPSFSSAWSPQSEKSPDGTSFSSPCSFPSSSSFFDNASSSASPSQDQGIFFGTGGTALIPFLKQTRDETKAAARYED